MRAEQPTASTSVEPHWTPSCTGVAGALGTRWSCAGSAPSRSGSGETSRLARRTRASRSS